MSEATAPTTNKIGCGKLIETITARKENWNGREQRYNREDYPVKECYVWCLGDEAMAFCEDCMARLIFLRPGVTISTTHLYGENEAPATCGTLLPVNGKPITPTTPADWKGYKPPAAIARLRPPWTHLDDRPRGHWAGDEWVQDV